MKQITSIYKKEKNKIRFRLNEFKSLPESNYIKELFFCLLTPQSNAKKCWTAVEKIFSLTNPSQEQILQILKTHTRFHNNKTRYLLEAKEKWSEIKNKLSEDKTIETRNWLAENVKGYGLKEAGHFLRNIGKSNNEIAILDRHILRNLVTLKIIEEEEIKNKKHYLEIEKKFLALAKSIKIPIDELDLLFWSKENGEIFK